MAKAPQQGSAKQAPAKRSPPAAPLNGEDVESAAAVEAPDDELTQQIDKAIAKLLTDFQDNKLKAGQDLSATVEVLGIAIKWQYTKGRSKKPKFGAGLFEPDQGDDE